MAVVTPLELEDLVAARHPARQTHCGHPGLGAGGDEAHLVDPGHHIDDEARQLDLEFARSAERGSLPGRFLNRGDDLRMGVSEQERSPALDEVDAGVAVNVGDGGAFGARNEERMRTYSVERPDG